MTRSSSSMPLRPTAAVDAKLGKVSPDRIDHRGLLPDEQMARAMEHQPALLLGRLDWHKPYIGSCDRLRQMTSASAASFFLPFRRKA